MQIRLKMVFEVIVIVTTS